jgi:hypothetical protein
LAGDIALRYPDFLRTFVIDEDAHSRHTEEGIAGFGDSVNAALRAFDAQYSRTLRPPSDLD